MRDREGGSHTAICLGTQRCPNTRLLLLRVSLGKMMHGRMKSLPDLYGRCYFYLDFRVTGGQHKSLLADGRRNGITRHVGLQYVTLQPLGRGLPTFPSVPSTPRSCRARSPPCPSVPPAIGDRAMCSHSFCAPSSALAPYSAAKVRASFQNKTLIAFFFSDDQCSFWGNQRDTTHTLIVLCKPTTQQ